MRVNLDDGGEVSPYLTPMIDCVFLLLIFFLVATTMKRPEHELKVELPPPAVAARPSDDRAPLTIGVDQAGLFYLGATPVGQAEIAARLRALGETEPDRHLRITVDRRAPSQSLVQLLDLCAFEGLRNYAIHTENRRPKE